MTPNIYEATGKAVPAGQIDRIVFARLSSLGIEPVVCSDSVFVRRAYLDVIGTLPTADEVKQFLDDGDRANKRRLLIEKLMEREEFSDYWAMKWGDLLRIKAEFPVNLWPNAAQAYHRWVRASIASNKRYDQFARELLTSSGSNFRVGPVNFYRAMQVRTPEGIAGAVALTLMGVRIDALPKQTVADMTVFFSQVGYKPTREWKEEVVFWDPMGSSGATKVVRAADAGKSFPVPAPTTAPTSRPVVPETPKSGVLPDGTKVTLSNRDPREVFADWLITPKNKWFTRNIANRAWAWLVGRGVIHEPDDVREGNPPSNPQLLAYLEQELISSKYDLKHLFRLILNSQTYQLSSVPHSKHAQAEANFASYPVRRLEAEVLIDAINAITGTSDLYTSAIPEPFTYIPQDQPAIAIADGSITSPFLTLFGRSARATGMENERTNKVVPAQWLHLLNSSHIQNKLDQSAKLRGIYTSTGRGEKEIVREMYLAILSRYPTPEEMADAEAYGLPPGAATRPVAKGGRRPQKRREDWVDLAWALVNSSEFIHRH